MFNLKKEELPDYGYEDYRQWEGDWELIEGIPYAMAPAPVKKHQLLVGYIFSELVSHMKTCQRCEVLIDEDWKLDEHTVLKPDVALVCDDENPNYISKTPEIIFEVISPSTAKRDEGIKFSLYEAEGVLYYVLVYPNTLSAKVYQRIEGRFTQIGVYTLNNEPVDFDDLSCPLTFDFSAVFKSLRR